MEMEMEREARIIGLSRLDLPTDLFAIHPRRLSLSLITATVPHPLP